MSNKVLKLASVEESIQNEDIRECLQIVIDEAAMQKAFMDIVKIDGPCQAADYIVCDVDGKELKIELAAGVIEDVFLFCLCLSTVF